MLKGVDIIGYMYTCPVCGASLDPGERCTCQAGDLPRRTEERPLPLYREEKRMKHPGKLSPAAEAAIDRIHKILK